MKKNLKEEEKEVGVGDKSVGSDGVQMRKERSEAWVPFWEDTQSINANIDIDIKSAAVQQNAYRHSKK